MSETNLNEQILQQKGIVEAARRVLTQERIRLKSLEEQVQKRTYTKHDDETVQQLNNRILEFVSSCENQTANARDIFATMTSEGFSKAFVRRQLRTLADLSTVPLQHNNQRGLGSAYLIVSEE